MSGTHALTVALFGCCARGIDGQPHRHAVRHPARGHPASGEKEGVSGSLKDFGIRYEQLDLTADGTVNYDAIPQAVKGAKVAYSTRRPATRSALALVEDIERIVQKVRRATPRPS